MTRKQSAHQLLREQGLTDKEAWGAVLHARFAKDYPAEYKRYLDAAIRQNGDATKRLTGYIQRFLARRNAKPNPP